MLASLIAFVILAGVTAYLMATDPDDYEPIEEPRRSELMAALKRHRKAKQARRKRGK